MAMAQRMQAVNLTLAEEQRNQLRELARANGMTISSLVRFLAAKAVDDPREFGLLPPLRERLDSANQAVLVGER